MKWGLPHDVSRNPLRTAQALGGRIEGEAIKRKLRVWSIKPKVMKKAVRRQHKVADAKSDHDILAAFGRRHGLKDALLRIGEKLL